MDNPLDRLARVWNELLPHHQADIEEFAPELYLVITGLVAMNSHTITDPATVAVPSPYPAVPRSAPRSHSAARWDRTDTYPTSGHIHPVQMPLPIELGDEK